MLRSKHGRDKLFSTPELLWEAACEYFQWCDENPWTTRKAIQRTVPAKVKKGKKVVTENQQQVQQEVIPTSRPYSLTGFCIYVGASSQWWRSFREDCKVKMIKAFLRSSHAWRKLSRLSSLREPVLEPSMRTSSHGSWVLQINRKWIIQHKASHLEVLIFFHILQRQIN